MGVPIGDDFDPTKTEICLSIKPLAAMQQGAAFGPEQNDQAPRRAYLAGCGSASRLRSCVAISMKARTTRGTNFCWG